MRTILFCILTLCLFSCKTDSKTPKVEATSVGYTIKGDTFDTKEILGYEEALSTFRGKDSLTAVQVRGTVESVCQTKGCWMTIASEKEGLDTMFVQFKDYGFFMPADLAGKEVVMQGNIYKEITSVEELKHMAHEDGLSEQEIDAITEPLEEVQFMADGVRILD